MPEQKNGLPKRLSERIPPPLADALYTFGTGTVAIALCGVAAFLFKQPLLFPSLGPTVYLFFGTPEAPEASPRNALLGHLLGIAAGYLSLLIFGLQNAPSVLQLGIDPARIGAAAVAVGLTGALLHLLKTKHPPAGATTLLVSLGMLKKPQELVMIAAGVLFLTVIAFLINRVCGVPVPVRAAKEKEPAG